MRFRGIASEAVVAWFTQDGVKTGCQQTAGLVMLKGMLNFLKNEDFDILAGESADSRSLEDLMKPFLGPRNTELEWPGDWIPGDWGNVHNKTHENDKRGLLQGMNIIYLGGSYSTGSAFASQPKSFWGPSRTPKRSLNEWLIEVASFSKKKFTDPIDPNESYLGPERTVPLEGVIGR